MDNIADIDPITDPEFDEYLKKFETIGQHNDQLRWQLSRLSTYPAQDYKLSVVIEFAREQQKLNENMYNLLVEMNNYFCAKLTQQP